MELRDGLVRILRYESTITVGTGFVASEKIIVTCAHVVEDAGVAPGGRIEVQFYKTLNHTNEAQPATVDMECWSPPDELDIAILRLGSPIPAGVERLYLGLSRELAGRPFTSYGFAEVGGFEELPVDGHIQGSIRDPKDREVLVLSSGTIKEGLSGAPVRDEATGLIVGMIVGFPAWVTRDVTGKKRQVAGDPFGRLIDLNFAATSESISSLCPELRISYRPPFLGLESFTEENADLFYGREKFVEKLLENMRAGARFIAVLGPSASGKSSVIHAGLFPKLRDGYVPESREWHLLSFRPGRDPYSSLTAAGLPSSHEISLVESVTTYLQKNQDVKHLVLFADQFEEVFALCPESIRSKFIKEWVGLLGKLSSVSLLLTIQAGYYHSQALEHPDLGQLIADDTITIAPMSKEELIEAIEKPAKTVQTFIEKGLAEHIVNEASKLPHPLPLIQESLRMLWEEEKIQQRLPKLTHETYHEKIKNVAGSIQARATKVYSELTDNEQDTARHIFTRLVRYGEGDEGITLRTQLLNTLITESHELESIQRVTKRLADERLLVIGEEPSTHAETVEIIHHILINEWKLLKNWIADDREFHIWLKRLQERINEWEQMDHSRGGLLRDDYLRAAEQWQAKRGHELNKDENAFIDASIRQMRLEAKEREEREQALQKEQKRRKRFAQFGVASLVLLLVVGSLAVFAFIQRSLAEENAVRADEARATAEIIADARATSEADAVHARATSVANENIAATKAVDETNARATAIVDRSEAERQAQIASANSLAAQAPRLLELPASDPELSLLLAVEAHRLDDESQGGTQSLIDSAFREILDLPYFSNTLTEHTSGLRSVALSSDGQYLASGDEEGQVLLWDLSKRGAFPEILRDNVGWVSAVTFSPDSKTLASGSDSGIIILRNIPDISTKPISLTAHALGVTSLVYSPDGDTLVSGSDDGTIRLWDLSNTPISSTLLIEQAHPVLSLDLSSDGRYLVASIRDTLYFWDLDAPDLEPVLVGTHQEASFSVAFNPDGSNFASAGSQDREVRLWDAVNPTADPVVLEGHQNWVVSLAYSPDGRLLASGDWDGVIRLWNLADLDSSPVELTGHEGGVFSLAFSSDSSMLASSSDDTSLRLWRLSPDNADNKIEVGTAGVLNVAYSPDENTIAVTENQGRVVLWDRRNQDDRMIVGEGEINSPEAIAFSPDGKLMVITSGDGTVSLWDTTNFELGSIILAGHKGAVTKAAFSPDGQILATASDDGTARLWDVLNPGTQPNVLIAHANKVISMAFSPDGQTLATGSQDNTIRLWNVSDPESPPLVITTLGEWIYSLAFSPDGETLAAGYDGGVVRLWDIKSNDPDPEVLVTRGGASEVLSGLAFSPDGKYLAAAGTGRLISIWNLSKIDADPIQIIGHEDWIISVVFSPDGRQIASSSLDGTVGLWTNPDMLPDLACEKVQRNLSWLEWNYYLGDLTYRPTCPELPPHASVRDAAIELAKAGETEESTALFALLEGHIDLEFDPAEEASKYMVEGIIEEGQDLAMEGDVAAATALFEEALRINSELDINPDEEAARWHVEGKLRDGRAAAREGNVEEAIDFFQQAIDLDPSLEIDPLDETGKIAVSFLINDGQDLALSGLIEGAVAYYEEATAIAISRQISAQEWHFLCWYGGAWEQYDSVSFACDNAIEMDPGNGTYYRGRAIGRAVSGDLEGAAEDMRAYLDWLREIGEYESLGARWEGWLGELEQGRNPFDEATLVELRQ